MKKNLLFSSFIVMIGLFSFVLFSTLDHKQNKIEVSAMADVGTLNHNNFRFDYNSSRYMDDDNVQSVCSSLLESKNIQTTTINGVTITYKSINDLWDVATQFDVGYYGDSTLFKNLQVKVAWVYSSTNISSVPLGARFGVYTSVNYNIYTFAARYPSTNQTYVPYAYLLQFFGGSDLGNDVLLQIFNGLSTLEGTNTYQVDLLTLDDLREQIEILESTIEDQQATIDYYKDLSEQSYDYGYADGVDSQLPFITNAYNNGYAEGYDAGVESNETAVTIFSGILQIAMVPVNFFLAIFNFEILGINVASFVSALLTIAITIIIIRIVTGKKND